MISRQSTTVQKQWSLEDFECIKAIGRGKFGEVQVVRQLSTDFVVALKIMKKSELESNNYFEQVQREIAIQSSLNHPNILKLYGHFWNSNSIILILEYAPKGQLFNILKKAGKLLQSSVAVILGQICQGLAYLHSRKVIHRDLKPENILVTSDCVKIGDFGWAVASESRRNTFCGTLDYLSPEMLKGEYHDSKVDIWALGILAFELSTGFTPFEQQTYAATLSNIVQQNIQFPTYLSSDIKNFIRRCLFKDPYLRPSASALLQDKLIRKYSGLPLTL